MSKFSSSTIVGVFVFLFIFSSFIPVAEAQKKILRKTRVLKKIIPKIGKKDKDAAKDAAKEESSTTAASETTETVKGRPPIIIIPGLIGSELVNKNTGEKVWFDLTRSKDDDLRLPVSPNILANHDNLVPRDILRKIQLIRLTPEIEIYQKLIDSLAANGYTEGKLDAPPENGYADTFYVFPYDWRLDNVENAQILLQKLDDLRSKLKSPNLKFNVVAHSMGGLIARYAEMYGKADLSAKTLRPTWKGASYFNNISLIATPNGGALTALDSLLNGFSLFGSGKINLPFVQNLTKYDLFTIPSIYQLLPPNGMVRAFDENLKPIRVDLYNPATWEKYGWTAYTNEEFPKKIENTTSEQAKAYFRAVLLRAKLFQAALDARPMTKNSVPIYYLGSECKPTINGMIIYKNAKDDKWETKFEADSFTKPDGTKVSKEELEKVLYSPGDGVVPKSSLVSSLLNAGKYRNPNSRLIKKDLTIACSEHNRLAGDEIIGKSLLNVLNLPFNMPNTKQSKSAISRRGTK